MHDSMQTTERVRGEEVGGQPRERTGVSQTTDDPVNMNRSEFACYRVSPFLRVFACPPICVTDTLASSCVCAPEVKRSSCSSGNTYLAALEVAQRPPGSKLLTFYNLPLSVLLSASFVQTVIFVFFHSVHTHLSRVCPVRGIPHLCFLFHFTSAMTHFINEIFITYGIKTLINIKKKEGPGLE